MKSLKHEITDNPETGLSSVIEGGFRALDWKDISDEAFEVIDIELEEFGLEVILLDAGTDDYFFKIVPRSNNEQDGTETEASR